RTLEAGLRVQVEGGIAVHFFQQPDRGGVGGERLRGAAEDLPEHFPDIQRAGRGSNDLVEDLKLSRPLGDGLLKPLIRAVELAGNMSVRHDAKYLVREGGRDEPKANDDDLPLELVMLGMPLRHQDR